MRILYPLAWKTEHLEFDDAKLVITRDRAQEIVQFKDIKHISVQCRVGYGKSETCYVNCVLHNGKTVILHNLPARETELLLTTIRSIGIESHELPKLLASDFPLLPDVVLPAWFGAVILAAVVAVLAYAIRRLIPQ